MPIISTHMGKCKFTGAQTSSRSYLSYKLGVFARPFSSRPLGNEVIGIDLGTTNSYVSIMEGKSAKVIEKVEVTNLTNTVFGTKRMIGRNLDDSQTQKEMGMVPYKIIKAPNEDAWVEASGQKYSPSQIGAFVLTKMTETAEAYLGKTINKAIITIPAYFNDAKGKPLRMSGELLVEMYKGSSTSQLPLHFLMA
ncbi:heat shock 70 kDa protein, mitochondrial [Tanacetum coccineum]|uniref:Heat shock 70 kDa protein, mitochondrial n=1 Tax=Tanacetum coccineum TaxID=301880 RepID=A0ABQ4ZVQ8_9ASTR